MTTSEELTGPAPRRQVEVGGRVGMIAFAAALPLVAFLVERDVGFGRADEGFLWYGVQRVLAGEVPQRDFQSYDIGRYYWSALWMLIADSRGLVSLRMANAILAGVTVALATMLVRPTDGTRPLRVALAALTFTVWMVPEYKVADSFAAILLIATLSRAIGRRDARGLFVFGVGLGVAATIGINHALYGTIGGALGLAYCYRSMRRSPHFREWVTLTLGAAFGYSPVLYCLVAVHGFAAAFVDAVRLLFEAGTTNVALPVPSVWTVFARGAQPFIGALRDSLLGAIVFAAPLFIGWCAWHIVRAREAACESRDPAVVAAVCLSIPYLHYAYSSYGVMHVAVSGLPILVAVSYLLIRRRGRSADALLIASTSCSLLLMLHAWNGYQLVRGRTTEHVQVLDDTLRVTATDAADLVRVKELVAAHPGRAFFAAHDWPGAYAAVAQRAPTWEIYQIFPARPERQRREIERLVRADPAFVLLTVDRPGDPTDGLEKTHPMIVEYIHRCFTRRPPTHDALSRHVEVYDAAARPCRSP